MNMKIYRSGILLALYGRETWYIALMEKRGLKMVTDLRDEYLKLRIRGAGMEKITYVNMLIRSSVISTFHQIHSLLFRSSY